MRSRLIGFSTLCLFACLVLAGCFDDGPRASFSATPSSGYPPLNVSFDASGSSSSDTAIIGYGWDFDDGETGSGILVSHTFEEKGFYTVTLTVTDALGRKDVKSEIVEARNRPPVALFSPSIYSTPVNQPVWFDAAGSYDPDGEIVEYIWDFGDGSVDAGQLVSHEYTTAGGSGWRPQITLTVIDNDGGQGSRTQEILVVGCDTCGG